MKISCLCVTEDRPTFMPWLVWNYVKQSWADKELILVDSSPDRNAAIQAIQDFDARHVLVVSAARGTSIGAKRNQAIASASGDVVCWFDDDDWQHPWKLTWIAKALEEHPEAAYCGWDRGWFVDLATRLGCEAVAAHDVFANTVGVRTPIARQVQVPRDGLAEDTLFQHALWSRTRAGLVMPLDGPTTPSVLWLQHGANTLPRATHGYDVPLQEIARKIGHEAWGDTDKRLRAVRVGCYTQRA